jgi:hypothetical protein
MPESDKRSTIYNWLRIDLAIHNLEWAYEWSNGAGYGGYVEKNAIKITDL